MKDVLTNSEILDRLLGKLDLKNDNQLSIELGVTRQQIRQFRLSEQRRLPQIIMTRLIALQTENESIEPGTTSEEEK